MSAIRKLKRVQTVEGTFAEWIKALRRVLGITQRELAERLGVSIRTVKKWERSSLVNNKNMVRMHGLLQQEINSIVNSDKCPDRILREKVAVEDREDFDAIVRQAADLNSRADKKGPSISWLKEVLENKLSFLSFIKRFGAIYGKGKNNAGPEAAGDS